MGRCSPPIGHKLTVLSLTKFGDRKNLRAIFFFAILAQKMIHNNILCDISSANIAKIAGITNLTKL